MEVQGVGRWAPASPRGECPCLEPEGALLLVGPWVALSWDFQSLEEVPAGWTAGPF